MANYCNLDEIKAELNITDESNDDLLQSSIEQAKEFIDILCNRRFDTVTGTKYYDGKTPLVIDDLVSVTTLKTDDDADGIFENTLVSTGTTADFLLYPLNEYPKTKIELTAIATCGLADSVKKGVEITGTWGYDSTVPEPIRRASIIQVCRWFKRKDSAFEDVTGNPVTGQMYVYKGLDPDVAEIVKQYRRWRY